MGISNFSFIINQDLSNDSSCLVGINGIVGSVIHPEIHLGVTSEHNVTRWTTSCHRFELLVLLPFTCIIVWSEVHLGVTFNPNKTGGEGAWWPPLDISRDNSATRKALATTLYDNFLSSFPHILTPTLWRPGVRFRSYITFCTCMHIDRKRLKMWFCVQNQCKLSFFT